MTVFDDGGGPALYIAGSVRSGVVSKGRVWRWDGRELVTLSNVPPDIRAKIEAEVVELLEQELPKAFPNRELEVERDGHVYKIVGDLSF